MDVSLMRSLISHNAVRPLIEVEGTYTTKTFSGFQRVFSGSFIIIDMLDEGDDIRLVTQDTQFARRYEIMTTDVATIDGMEPTRFAAVHEIAPDGSKIKRGMKRGRKPKNRVLPVEECRDASL